MAAKVWEASGHVSGFSDPMVVCNYCKTKFRADHLLQVIGVVADEKCPNNKSMRYLTSTERNCIVPCAAKKDFGKVVGQSLLATATLGKFEKEDKDVYLRGEMAQGIFINYKNVLGSGMYSIPFVIPQVGKAFRNEISPRQFLCFCKRELNRWRCTILCRPRKPPTAYEEWKKKEWLFMTALG